MDRIVSRIYIFEILKKFLKFVELKLCYIFILGRVGRDFKSFELSQNIQIFLNINVEYLQISLNILRV